MNISGKNVKLACRKYSIQTPNLIVLHDCLETKVGKFKVSTTASFKGHNGLKSISQEFGGAKDFTRVALGIGRPIERDAATVSSYVLSPFSDEDQESLSK